MISFLGRLLLFLSFVFLATGAAGLLGLIGRERSQVDLFLRSGSHQKLVSVHQTLAHLDVTLLNKNTCLMNGLGLEPLLVYPSLQSLVQKFINS